MHINNNYFKMNAFHKNESIDSIILTLFMFSILSGLCFQKHFSIFHHGLCAYNANNDILAIELSYWQKSN